MRIRTIKPEMWESRTFGRMSAEARLLFLACISAADDEGLVPWDAHFAKAKAFPYQDVTTEQVTGWMNELATTDLVYVYEDRGDAYAMLTKFRKHQRIDRPSPSKRPLPDFTDEFTTAILNRDDHVCAVCSTRIPDAETAQLLVKVGKDKELRIAQPRVDQPSSLIPAHNGCHATTGPKRLVDPQDTQLAMAVGQDGEPPRARNVKTP